MKRGVNVFLGIFTALIVGLSYSCANRGGGPQGGPKDETPPQVLKSTPANGITNFQKKEIEINFDEYVSLENVNDNVIVSPPQQKNPEIVSYGKRIMVNFLDDLKENTTYTINFGNAIVDLNESNPLANYRFSFATGDDLDSLRISGYMINAKDLNPISGIYVGIYADISDSAFLKEPFLRIGRTDSEGYFSVDNIKEGSYRLYALKDNNRNYFFQPGEGLAFHDSIITPYFEWIEHRDTIWAADSISIDTMYTYAHNHFLPNDIVLRYFEEDKIRQYFVKAERLQPEKFTLFFNTTLSELPQIEPLNFNWEGSYILQRNNTLDTLNYWITDSAVWSVDTLQIALSYFKTDSIFQLVPTTDTVNIMQRKSKGRARAVSKQAAVKALDFKSNILSVFEIYNPIKLSIAEPILSYEPEKIHLYQKVDTILKPLNFVWERSDSTNMNYAVKYNWQPGIDYQFDIDSAAFVSVYSKANNKYRSNFKIRELEEYSELTVELVNYDPRAVIQLLDDKDNVLSTKPAITKQTVFKHLNPADYYLRLFIDENGNEKWDTGDLTTKRQPEEVYYYPYKLTLKANFDFIEQWNHKTTPLLKQKPQAIKRDVNSKKK